LFLEGAILRISGAEKATINLVAFFFVVMPGSTNLFTGYY
jgi:hypothetical protein